MLTAVATKGRIKAPTRRTRSECHSPLLIIRQYLLYRYYRTMLSKLKEKGMSIDIIVASRLVFVWMLVLIFVFVTAGSQSVLMKFGPNESLIIFGVPINTISKYITVVAVCFLNSAIRTVNSNMIYSWILNHIQDTKMVSRISPAHAYEVSLTHALYVWIDFYTYMNIIMTQVDLFCVEVLSECIMTTIITRYYLGLHHEAEEFSNIELPVHSDANANTSYTPCPVSTSTASADAEYDVKVHHWASIAQL